MSQRSDLGATGLTAAQVAERVAAGQVNDQGRQPTRTAGQILLANIATRFNAILGGLFVVIAIIGPVQDGLFGLVLVANSGIGIAQGLRAKRTLDRLTVLNAPTAAVLRDGMPAQVPAAAVVLDDVVDLRPGDQVVVDGTVLSSGGPEVDESLLSGEADPVAKQPGGEVLSGSFVVAGSGRIAATAVGPGSYAARLAEQAKSYSPARSEIRDATNKLLKWISWLLVQDLPAIEGLAPPAERHHAGARRQVRRPRLAARPGHGVLLGAQVERGQLRRPRYLGDRLARDGHGRTGGGARPGRRAGGGRIPGAAARQGPGRAARRPAV